MTPEEMDHFKQFFPKIESALGEAASRHENPEMAAVIREMQTEFSLRSQEFFALHAETDAWLKQEMADVMQQLDQSQKDLTEELEKTPEAPSAPLPAAPAQPQPHPEPIDPEIGRKLCDRLVALCDPQSSAMTAMRQRHPVISKTVEDWAMESVALSSQFSSAVAAAARSSVDAASDGSREQVSPDAKTKPPAQPAETPPVRKKSDVDSWFKSSGDSTLRSDINDSQG